MSSPYFFTFFETTHNSLGTLSCVPGTNVSRWDAMQATIPNNSLCGPKDQVRLHLSSSFSDCFQPF